MSLMFDSLDDEIFVDKTLDKTKINASVNKYLNSDATEKEKVFLLKLKKLYFVVKDIPNYKDVQNSLYGNKSKIDIISFELTRIIKYEKIDDISLKQVDSIKKIISDDKKDLSDDLYIKIINLIIKIEISLGMNVGLFNEVCNYLEGMIKEIDNDLSKPNLIYTKKM